jgi:hypothetical protein
MTEHRLWIEDKTVALDSALLIEAFLCRAVCDGWIREQRQSSLHFNHVSAVLLSKMPIGATEFVDFVPIS